MEKFVYDFCLERHSSGSAHDRDSGIQDGVAFLCLLVRFALFFELRRSLRQPLPRHGQLGFPSKQLQRFLRGFVHATAYGFVTAPASVLDDARAKMNWMRCIFARAMDGFVVREEMRLQTAAAACIAGKSGIIAAVENGDFADVLSYLIADVNCVNERDG